MFCDGIDNQVAKCGQPEAEYAPGAPLSIGFAAAIEKYLCHLRGIAAPKVRRVGSEEPAIEMLRDSNDAFCGVCHYSPPSPVAGSGACRRCLILATCRMRSRRSVSALRTHRPKPVSR